LYLLFSLTQQDVLATAQTLSLDFLDEPKNMPSDAFLEPEFPLLRLFCVLYSKKLQKIWWFQKNVVNLHRD